jgi:aryl-alcohol dehydrogenase-like predicted oxidoreductase
VIRHAGLSEVSLDDIQAAQAHFKVATVQNLYNVRNRASEPVLDYCAANGIGFMPWYPLGQGSVLASAVALRDVAAARHVSPTQIALAWLMTRSPVMLPIPGTSSLAHLRENVEAASIRLSETEMSALDGDAARTSQAAV